MTAGCASDPGTATISGIVHLDGERCRDMCTVEMTFHDGPEIVNEIAQIVGADGLYLWTGLRGGAYTITAWHHGRSGTADVQLAAAEDATADVYIADR